MPAFSASSRATLSGPGLLNESMVHFPFNLGKQLREDTANEGIAYGSLKFAEFAQVRYTAGTSFAADRQISAPLAVKAR